MLLCVNYFCRRYSLLLLVSPGRARRHYSRGCCSSSRLCEHGGTTPGVDLHLATGLAQNNMDGTELMEAGVVHLFPLSWMCRPKGRRCFFFLRIEGKTLLLRGGPVRHELVSAVLVDSFRGRAGAAELARSDSRIILVLVHARPFAPIQC